MILDALVREEVPPLTALVHNMHLLVAVFISPAVPARLGVIKVRVILEPGQVPEAASLGDCADPAGQEAVGPAILRSV